MLLDARDMSADGNNMSAGGNNMFDDVDGDLLAEALPWIAGHCRFVTTNLPCGVVGVSIAAQLLAAIPDACRRRVPDITGSGPDVFARAVDYGLLAEVPSARVIRSVPKLIADASPIFQRRGKRHWTLWIVHRQDAREDQEADAAKSAPGVRAGDSLAAALPRAACDGCPRADRSSCG